MSLKVLNETCAELNRSWDDEAFHRFVETYLTPVEPRLKGFREATRRLAEVLEKAARDCGDA